MCVEPKNDISNKEFVVKQVLNFDYDGEKDYSIYNIGDKKGYG